MGKELKESDIIPFIRSKDYKFVQNLGTGSFAKTILLKDEIIDEFYACKKYDPNEQGLDEREKQEYFEKFIKEVKILNKIVHPNIVRIYNNYMYPSQKVGYIIMEYVENGKSIDEYIKNNPDRLNEIFEQIIEGFSYLEKMKLCHGDIRSSNILIDSDGKVKIIDFGFGKNYMSNVTVSSLTLCNNWIATPPSEMETRDDNKPIYNNKTEVYFVGKLVKSIVEINKIEDFKYESILNEMIEYNCSDRINSFGEIKEKMAENRINSKKLFTEEQKSIYKKVVSTLDEIIESVEYGTRVNEYSVIVDKLEELAIKYSLEDKVLNNRDFAECFFEKVDRIREAEIEFDNYEGDYYEINVVPTSLIIESIDLLKQFNQQQKMIVVQNLQTHLEKYKDAFSDLPF